MSSAIEVLKKAQSDIDTDVYIAWSEIEAIEIHNALSEALLALEKQEKLTEWLEKEIEKEEEIIKGFGLENVCANRHVLTKLKEVLEEFK